MTQMFDGPPALAGDETQQLISMYRYLQQVSDRLNEAMNNITVENFSQGTRETIQTVMDGGNAEKKIRDSQNTLKSMIIKTAEIVRTEMEEIRTQLTERVTAVSEEFGTMEREVTNSIEANAEGIRQTIETVETIQSAVNGVEGYVERTSGYIFSGIIGQKTDSGGNTVNVLGIAIGEGITAYDAGGNAVINDAAKVATFTKDRLSFYQGGVEMAYFSDRKMYISSAEVTGALTMGNYIWKIHTDNSMSLMVNG